MKFAGLLSKVGNICFCLREYGRLCYIYFIMITRPSYKDYLNQTPQTPDTFQSYSRIPPSENRPPLPNRPKRLTLPQAVDISQCFISSAIAGSIKDQPFLRETYDSYGANRINSLKKRNGSRSAKDLSANKSDMSPYRKAKDPRQELSFYQERSRNNLLDPMRDIQQFKKVSSNSSFADSKNRADSRSKGNLDTPYDLYKSSSNYNSKNTVIRPRTAIDSSKQEKKYSDFLDPSRGRQEKLMDKTPKSRKGSANEAQINIFTPIQFRSKYLTAERSDPRDYCSRQKSREKSPTWGEQSRHQKSPFRGGESRPGKSPFRGVESRSGKSPFRGGESRHQKSPFRGVESRPGKSPFKGEQSRSSFGSSKQKMSFQDFMVGKKLGEGRFGHVFMVIHKGTGAIFALKRIPKTIIRESLMIDQLVLEVRLQASFYHPNIVSLYAVFDDKQHIYLLTEYLSGGSLYSELKQKGKFEQEETVHRIFNLCRAVETLHLRGVAHRDIKPENIMMCEKQCKLGDFGWATICDKRRMTYCGTMDYVSPEIVEGKEYGEGVDMWCVGVLTFELLSGRPPFYHLSRQETFRKIEEADPSYPSYFSLQAKDFIGKLLKKVPEERMSSVDALLHPFLANAEK